MLLDRATGVGATCLEAEKLSSRTIHCEHTGKGVLLDRATGVGAACLEAEKLSSRTIHCEHTGKGYWTEPLVLEQHVLRQRS